MVPDPAAPGCLGRPRIGNVGSQFPRDLSLRVENNAIIIHRHMLPCGATERIRLIEAAGGGNGQPPRGYIPADLSSKLAVVSSDHAPPGCTGGVSANAIPQKPTFDSQPYGSPPYSGVVPRSFPVRSKSNPATGLAPSSPPVKPYTTLCVQASPTTCGGAS